MKGYRGTWEDSVLSVEDLEREVRKVGFSFKRPHLPKTRKIGRLERVMNRLGWYRQTEFLVIDSSQLPGLNPFSPIPWKPEVPK